MKAKRIMKSALAVIMAAMMLASCGAAEDVSADGENRLTRAGEVDEANSDEKTEETKAGSEEKAEETTKTESDDNKTNTDTLYFPDSALYTEYDDNEYIIDKNTGKVLMDFDFSENDLYKKLGDYAWIEDNLLIFHSPGDSNSYVALDMNKKLINWSSTNDNPPDSVYIWDFHTSTINNGKYVYVQDGLYGIKDADGNILLEALYSRVAPDPTYTRFAVSRNNLVTVLDSEMNEIFSQNTDYEKSTMLFGDNLWFGDKRIDISTGIQDFASYTKDYTQSANYLLIYEPSSYGYELYNANAELIKSGSNEEIYSSAGVNPSPSYNMAEAIIRDDGYFLIQFDSISFGFNEKGEYLYTHKDFAEIFAFYFAGILGSPNSDTISDKNNNIIAEDAQFVTVVGPMSENSIIYYDVNKKLYGVIKDGKIAMEADYDDYEVDGRILLLERGNKWTRYIGQTLVEAQLPE
jgi:hypothetical protein